MAAKRHSAAKPRPKELRTAESASWKQRKETRGLGGPRLLIFFDKLRDSDVLQRGDSALRLFAAMNIGFGFKHALKIRV
jgi:coproporphyrinogen III oxidase